MSEQQDNKPTKNERYTELLQRIDVLEAKVKTLTDQQTKTMEIVAIVKRIVLGNK